MNPGHSVMLDFLLRKTGEPSRARTCDPLIKSAVTGTAARWLKPDDIFATARGLRLTQPAVFSETVLNSRRPLCDPRRRQTWRDAEVPDTSVLLICTLLRFGPADRERA